MPIRLFPNNSISSPATKPDSSVIDRSAIALHGTRNLPYPPRSLAKQPTHIELALWFHDAVYDARSATNEEDSAALAIACLEEANVARSTIETVRQLILCTKTHEPGGDPDAELLIDIDLAILGQPTARFWEYERAIRAEYAWVPAETFAQKRAEILMRFLRRPTLYRTGAFQRSYEATARTNLRAAIAQLQQ